MFVGGFFIRFLCWDRGNGDVPPTLDATLLCSSRAGSDLGLESGLVEELCQLGFFFPRRSCVLRSRDKTVLFFKKHALIWQLLRFLDTLSPFWSDFTNPENLTNDVFILNSFDYK